MSKYMDEFKEFIARGNVMDMAVGVIIGGAFTGIVTALTDNIINPLITAITGETAQSFILTIRMSRARHLLDNNPELNITEIALMCAYNDAPNFTRAFKNTFGITPTQYLEKKHK